MYGEYQDARRGTGGPLKPVLAWVGQFYCWTYPAEVRWAAGEHAPAWLRTRKREAWNCAAGAPS